MTRSAHTIEVDQYDIDDIDMLHTFHSVYRSTVASQSNDTDPDSKTKIVTKIGIKLPHRRVVDKLQVKVDDGAEANLLPLHSFRSMFPHALVGDGYPLDGFLDNSRTRLECYNDGKLVNHGSITLKLKHYSNGSFQDHQFFIVETPARREIIIGHLASVRLGLVKVLCQNIAQPVTAKEAKSPNLTKITNTDGKIPRRWLDSRSEYFSGPGRLKGRKFDSFQDPRSRPSYRNGHRECKMSSFQDPISRPLRAYIEENLVISDYEPLKQPTEDLAAESKTLQINGIQVSSEKYIEESHFKTPTDGTRGSREQCRPKLTPFKTPVHVQDRDLIHFKTLGKSGTKVSSKLTPFKTPDVTHRTGRVHFKTFDDWIKARKANCDTLLKDVSSFISEKEEDQQSLHPSRRQPNSRLTPRSPHIDRGKIFMGDCPNRRKSTMEHRGKSTME